MLALGQTVESVDVREEIKEGGKPNGKDERVIRTGSTA